MSVKDGVAPSLSVWNKQRAGRGAHDTLGREIPSSFLKEVIDFKAGEGHMPE
ncbi:unnamed protein product [Ectocarpus sp. CCAP 1310/34]|nr:unnamed protein product [Ectocarpus sp. CCAP 1310/34]